MSNEWKLEDILAFYDKTPLDSKEFSMIYEKIEVKVSEYMVQEMKINNFTSDVMAERMRLWTIYLRKYKIKKLRQ